MAMKSKLPLPSSTPRVVVKFRDSIVPNPVVEGHEDFVDAIDRFLGEFKKSGLWKKLSELGAITTERLITEVTPQQIRALVAAANKRNPEYEPPNFFAYFGMPCRTRKKAWGVVEFLRKYQHETAVGEHSFEVELAYVESGPTRSPTVNPGDDPDFPMQTYLLPAPDGIDAQFAWTKLGGDGDVTSAGPSLKLQFVDVEQGWWRRHEDLRDITNIPLLFGESVSEWGHGTGVLGIVAAVDNDKGIVGIAPNLNSMAVSSIWIYDPTPPTSWPYKLDRPNAIMVAAASLKAGDVLLLELQVNADGYYPGVGWSKGDQPYNDLPVEVEPAVFAQIQLATEAGIVVVEAAGNGGWDLDLFTSGPWYDTRGDSGAIMVAAATSGSSHAPLVNQTNFGSRIDCYAPGEHEWTTGFQDTTGANPPATAAIDYFDFTGTSAASAIIAGAALVVQGIAQTNQKGDIKPGDILSYNSSDYRYWPSTLRDHLSDQTRGTPSVNPNADKIGVMPDLKKIVNRMLRHIITDAKVSVGDRKKLKKQKKKKKGKKPKGDPTRPPMKR